MPERTGMVIVCCSNMAKVNDCEARTGTLIVTPVAIEKAGSFVLIESTA